MITSVPFYYLRHGETDWNLQRRMQGRSDVPLNETGIAQAHAAKSLLTGLEIRTVCTSPLARARDTAEIVNQTLGCPVVTIDDLAECSFGDYEGEFYGDWVAAWRRGDPLPGAEPYDAFLARSVAGINRALTHEGPVLIVAHGGVYWAIQHHGRIDADGPIPNGVPVRHEPPTDDFPGWKAEAVA